MKRALLIVDHGSRRREAHAHLERVAEDVRRRAPDVAVEVAHMEIARPSISEAIDAAVRDGAEEVVVIPFFLVPGRHLREDIPRLVDAAARRHPALVVRIADALGSVPGVADLVLRAAGADGGTQDPEG